MIQHSERAEKLWAISQMMQSLQDSGDIEQAIIGLDVDILREGLAAALEIHEKNEDYEACTAIRAKVLLLLTFREMLLSGQQPIFH